MPSLARRRGMLVLSATLAVSGGCHEIFRYTSVGGRDAPRPVVDAALDLPQVPDGPPLPDLPPPSLAGICPLTADAETVGLFDFVATPDGRFANQVGPSNAGHIVGDLPSAAPIACAGGGRLFDNPIFAATPCADCETPTSAVECLESGYAWIPSWPELEGLGAGAIDFWVRFDYSSAEPKRQFVLSRDASRTLTDGHLSVWLEDDVLAVRLQSQGNDTDEVPCACSAPEAVAIADGAWHHVGINFGPAGLELYVDGARQAGDGRVLMLCQCGDSSSIVNGIGGNREPIVVGAGAAYSCDNSAEPVNNPMYGALANLRISRVRRPFDALPMW